MGRVWKVKMPKGFDIAAEMKRNPLPAGSLFKCPLLAAGFYVENKLRITASDLQSAIAAFRPPMALRVLYDEKTMLDGRVGALHGLLPGDDGDALYGLVVLPEGVAVALKDIPWSLAAQWDAGSKQVRACALVTRDSTLDRFLSVPSDGDGAPSP